MKHSAATPVYDVACERALEVAVRILLDGGVIAFPTDTLYGLGAHPYILPAIERVFDIKGRPRGMALPLLLGEVADINAVACNVPAVAWRLAERFLPGPLTLVLWKRPEVPDLVTGGKPTVAVRVPDHSLARELVRRLQAPITGTSANLTGKPAPKTAQEAESQVGELVDLLIDGGRCLHGAESTVVDLTTPVPRVLRTGVILPEHIRQFLGSPLEVS